MTLYGTVDDWKKASPSKREEFKKNIESGLENGQVTSDMLGRFLVVTDDAERGEEILYQAIKNGVEGAEGEYVDTISYYYMKNGKYNSLAKQDKWFSKWISAAERSIDSGEENAEVRLADIYKTCYKITDPEFNNIVDCTIELYYTAARKHQRNGALNCGLFIQDRIGTDEFKAINPEKYQNWEEAGPFLMQSLKDEKHTKYKGYAHESVCWFYMEYIRGYLDGSIDYYFEEKELTNLVNIIMTNRAKILDNIKDCGEMADSIESSLNSRMIHFEFLLLADKLRGVDEFQDISDSYVRQINKKKFPGITNKFMKEEAVDKMSEIFLGDKQQYFYNGKDYTKDFYNFIEQRNSIKR